MRNSTGLPEGSVARSRAAMRPGCESGIHGSFAAAVRRTAGCAVASFSWCNGEIARSPRGTLTFEGEEYGSGVSFFLVCNQPGEGPDLHRHPYSETWIVRSGRALITIDGHQFEAGAGDIAVVGPNTPHMFKNVGKERLDIICIHASPKMIQEELS